MTASPFLGKRHPPRSPAATLPQIGAPFLVVLSCSVSGLQDFLDRLPLVQYCARREMFGVPRGSWRHQGRWLWWYLLLIRPQPGPPKQRGCCRQIQAQRGQNLTPGHNFDLVEFWGEIRGRLQLLSGDSQYTSDQVRPVRVFLEDYSPLAPGSPRPVRMSREDYLLES